MNDIVAAERPPLTMDLAIKGMTCAACVRRVETVIGRVPGVTGVEVNLATEQARVRATPDIDVQSVMRAVEKAGYEAARVSADEPAADTSAEDTRETALLLVSLLLSVPLLAGMIIPSFMLPGWAQCLLATPVQFWIGWRFHDAGARAALAGSANMDLLVSLGTTAAWSLSTWNWLSGDHAHDLYYESSAVLITFVLLGKWLERRARRQTVGALRGLRTLTPTTARILRDGIESDVPVSAIRPGDRLVVRPGERLPADGRVIEGAASIDASLVTGESLPVLVEPGTRVIGGVINMDGRLVIEVMATGGDTMLGRIIRAIESAQASKAPVQQLVDRVSAVFVPVVLGGAVLTLLCWLVLGVDQQTAWMRAVAVLVIACPCALGLATPAALMAGIGLAARRGILIRDAAALERACTVRIVAFDKTGTLTVGHPGLTAIVGADRAEVLRLSAALQSGSEHKLAEAVRKAASDAGVVPPPVSNFRALAGRGVVADIDGATCILGNRALLREMSVPTEALEQDAAALERSGHTVSWLARIGEPHPIAILAFADALKPTARHAVATLRAAGLHTAIISGDSEGAVAGVAETLGVDEARAGVLPNEKAAVLAALRDRHGPVAMVGDGLNDGPALAAADVGIAMGNGTDVAMETAGITLMRGDPDLVLEAIDISRRTARKIRVGLFWAFAYNVMGIPLAALGYLSPLLAGAAMAFSSVSVVANALLLGLPRRRATAPPQVASSLSSDRPRQSIS